MIFLLHRFKLDGPCFLKFLDEFDPPAYIFQVKTANCIKPIIYLPFPSDRNPKTVLSSLFPHNHHVVVLLQQRPHPYSIVDMWVSPWKTLFTQGNKRVNKSIDKSITAHSKKKTNQQQLEMRNFRKQQSQNSSSNCESQLKL